MSNSNETNLATILLVGLAILVLGSTLMMGFAMPMLGGMYGYSGMDGLGIIGVLVQLAFLLVALGGGYLLVRRVTDPTASRDGAMDELRTATRAAISPMRGSKRDGRNSTTTDRTHMGPLPFLSRRTLLTAAGGTVFATLAGCSAFPTSESAGAEAIPRGPVDPDSADQRRTLTGIPETVSLAPNGTGNSKT